MESSLKGKKYKNSYLFTEPEQIVCTNRFDEVETCFSAFISTARKDILSFSPELFFERNKSIVNVNPMKGTASRGFSCEEDLRRKDFLLNDAKNLSENIMIVDLLRNDLGKISQTGSVKVKRLFEIQEYSTLYQMTSSIESKLEKGVLYYDIFKALFPCGSVTGAPKIRTMEIIEELEENKRDVYCGAIGFISPEKRSVFNVPIRTLYKEKEEKAWTYRVGSGIVWDSKHREEWLECGVKTEFLSREALPDFFIFETLLLQNGRLVFREEHIRRLKASAKFFDFPFCKKSLMVTIDEILEKQMMQEKIIKIILQKNGAFVWEKRDYKKPANKVSKVVLSKKQVDKKNLFLYHKTSYRPCYDNAMTNKQNGLYFDKLFFNTKGELTEGTRTNVFVEINSQLYTPYVDAGLLPGVLRANLLANNVCQEKVLYIEDLQEADAVYCGNSVRGLVQVDLLF